MSIEKSRNDIPFLEVDIRSLQHIVGCECDTRIRRSCRTYRRQVALFICEGAACEEVDCFYLAFGQTQAIRGIWSPSMGVVIPKK